MKRLFILIVLCIVFHLGKSQTALQFADSLMYRNKIPELGYAVISVDTILELEVLGYHRIDSMNEKGLANKNDYFHVGSNTKAITGFVAACLVEENKIQWTTKFFDLFPTWKKDCNQGYYDITLAELLSHRAKINRYTSGIEYDELPDFKGSTAEQRKQFVKYILNEKPVKGNEKLYTYSNAGYSVAALMLEKVTGKTWEQLTKETMLKKVNAHVQYGWPTNLSANQPYGHWLENDVLKPVERNNDYNLAMGEPAGDISMTLPEYARFVQLNLKGVVGTDNVLKASTYNFLHYGLKEYAIGWRNANTDQLQLTEHAGSAGTFYTYTLLDKKKKLAFILVANSSTTAAQNSLFELLKRLRKDY